MGKLITRSALILALVLAPTFQAYAMPFPLDPCPSLLWTLRRDGKVAPCEVRLVPTGSDVRMLRNGSLLMAPEKLTRGLTVA